MPFTALLKSMQCLGQKLTRNTIINGGNLHILKMSALPKVTFKFNIIPAKIPKACGDLQNIFKVYLEDCRHRK